MDNSRVFAWVRCALQVKILQVSFRATKLNIQGRILPGYMNSQVHTGPSNEVCTKNNSFHLKS